MTCWNPSKVRRFEDDSGTAMMVAISFLAAMTVGASAFLSLYHRSNSHFHGLEAGGEAYYLAEAGVARAVAELRSGGDFEGCGRTPLGRGAYSVKVDARGDRAYAVTALGEILDGEILLRSETLTVMIAFDGDGRLIRRVEAED